MFPKFNMKIYYQSNGGTGGAAADDKSDDKEVQDKQGDPETLESYIATLPKEQQDKFKPLLDAHIVKLSNTVKATREERDAFQKQLSDAIKKAENGKVDKAELEKLSAQAEEASRKSDFYEQAPQFECRNPKAAYAIAKVNDFFTKSGAPDWNAIKEEAPEFFGKAPMVTKKKTAGNGTNDEPVSTNTMNDFIRRSAGIQT